MSTNKHEWRDLKAVPDRRTTRFDGILKWAAMLTLSLLAAAGPGTHSALATSEPDGTLDLTFDAGTFTNGQVDAAVLQPDGKLLIAGRFNKVHGVPRHRIARLNLDGTLDLSFDPGSGPESFLKGMILQPDGKIIIFGPDFRSFNGVNRSAGFARLNSDGSLDISFDPGRGISRDGIDDGSGGATNPGTVFSAVLQLDGKIVVVGRFSFVITGPGVSVSRSCVAGFNSNGTFDPSYDPGSGASRGPFTVTASYAARQNVGINSGKVIIKGDFDTFDNQPVPGLVRLNADGSLDFTFFVEKTTDYFVSGLFVQSDDRIVIFGLFPFFNGVVCSGIVRLNSSGGVDNGFVTAEFSNYGELATVSGVAQQPDGKLIVGGHFHSLDGMVANNLVRLETTGAKDTSFDSASAGPSASNVTAVLVRPTDGRIFAGGYFSTYAGALRNNMAWVNGNGSVDGTFAGLSGATDGFPQIYALATQADGKIVVGGSFSSLNGASHYNVVRLNPDSTLDPSFDANLGTYGRIRALHIQPDGKILIAGDIQAVNGVRRGGIARLNMDGALDTSFDPGTGASFPIIFGIARDSAGDIYVVGIFLTFDGESRRMVAKLSPTGALDPIFNQAGGGPNNTVYAIAAPDDAGGIVIGGQFTNYDGQAARRVARLDVTTGELDPGFTPPLSNGFNNTVFALQLASDGKYYAGGLFENFNGVSRSRVARLNSDGSLDATFAGPSISSRVDVLALQNGKVLAGGPFVSPPGRLVRLTDSGALDSTFATGTGIDSSPANAYVSLPAVSALAIQADHKLLIGGIFNQYNGIPRVCLARLNAAPVSPTPTPTPGITPTPTPTPTPPPTPIPGPTPSTFGNISTRLRVETGDNVLIGGFIISGTQAKRIIVRAIGPSLPLAGALTDPILELRNSSGDVIVSNDNWRSGGQEGEIIATTIPPSHDLESAIVATLPANNTAYTAIVRGVNNGTGIGVVEVYDLDRTVNSKLANISTRGLVQTGDDVLIGGLIVLGENPLRVIVRAIGPSLPLSGALGDPTLNLHDGNGTIVASNNNWREDPAQESEIIATGIPPSSDLESAIVQDLAPGSYTAIVRGVNNTTGIAVVEAYGLN